MNHRLVRYSARLVARHDDSNAHCNSDRMLELPVHTQSSLPAASCIGQDYILANAVFSFNQWQNSLQSQFRAEVNFAEKRGEGKNGFVTVRAQFCHRA